MDFVKLHYGIFQQLDFTTFENNRVIRIQKQEYMNFIKYRKIRVRKNSENRM
ncbi:hypothetical protein LEP1GSC193_0187 [Leptospira alstonii serovar Pingchang str. 80-412]|uniref:Uncharacterized protein n=2 Tax=Leptospira alstonii TaxID=28452 RepID=M6CM82_9LEPT|nr:hypothetical protein LEP1GSC194_3836 [Leptospira alstonii serovar Sichuan str. 79601]EQA79009.1 hypothetical protein LEP1GSC193_0187 [Leptospira alstonii serovar Pingchang str. 80-412]